MEEKNGLWIQYHETINTEDTVTSEEFKKQVAQELKQNWHEKKIHGHAREIPEKADKDRTWQWLSKSDLKIGTEALHRNRPSGQTM